jgi:hypothetical protein
MIFFSFFNFRVARRCPARSHLDTNWPHGHNHGANGRRVFDIYTRCPLCDMGKNMSLLCHVLLATSLLNILLASRTSALVQREGIAEIGGGLTAKIGGKSWSRLLQWARERSERKRGEKKKF